MSHKKVVTLDVREDLRQGREPFSRIMQSVAALRPGQDFLLLAPFQPTPLFSVLAQQGFSHQARPTPTGDWEVLFSRSQPPNNAEPNLSDSENTAPPCPASPNPAVFELDARGLEPPEPLMRIMQAVHELPPGAHLRARTDRNPLHLHPRLQERGYAGQTSQEPDGSFVTHIRPGGHS